MATQYKVSRAGKPVGTFTIWGIKEGVQTGQLQWTDDFWTQGMNEWAKLEVIKKQILSAEQPKAESGSAVDLTSENPIASKLPLIGLIFFFVGLVVLAVGFIRDPDGSAIRQQVLMQQMTNGILLMILGAIVIKK